MLKRLQSISCNQQKHNEKSITAQKKKGINNQITNAKEQTDMFPEMPKDLLLSEL